MLYREIELKDIPELFYVRVRTDENNLSIEELERLGINHKAVEEKMLTSFRGWLCEISGKVAGFAMGDKNTGELWVIAVLPEYIQKGIGGELLKLVEEWLFSEGCEKLWLTTDIDTQLRAYAFYINRGWKDDKIENGMRYMCKYKMIK